MRQPVDTRGSKRRAGRAVLLGTVSAIPLAAVLLLSLQALVVSARDHFPCPLYPNAVVALSASPDDGCPLSYGSRIVTLEVGERAQFVNSAAEILHLIGEEKSRSLRVGLAGPPFSEVEVRLHEESRAQGWARLISSLVLGAMLLLIACLTAVRADVAASVPFAIFYAAVGALMVESILGGSTVESYPITAAARALLPAALADLALVFPTRRESIVRVPALRFVLYGIALVLWLVEVDSAYRSSDSTMIVVQQVLLAAAVGAFVLLCLASYLAARESPSLLRRRQCRAFLLGVSSLGALTIAAHALDPPGGGIPAVTVGAALSPLPLGYAIARYQLFDLDVWVRAVAAHLAYLMSVSALVFVPVLLFRDSIQVPDVIRAPPVLFATIFCLVSPLDLLRAWIKSFTTAAFRPARWDHLRLDADFPTNGDPGDIDWVARRASAVLAKGLRDAENAIFVPQGGGFRLATASGPRACTDPDAVSIAERLSVEAPVDLNRCDLDLEGQRLYDLGVQVSCPIRGRRGVFGWILVSPRRPGVLFPVGQLAFLTSIASQLAVSFENAVLTEALVVADRFAARGRIHAELAHEIGKPLGTLEVMAARLARRWPDDGDLTGALRTISRLASDLRKIVRGILDPLSGALEQPTVELPDVVAVALAEVDQIHGPGRVVVHPFPATRGFPPEVQRLSRVLVNVIDNGLRASEDGSVVDLAITEMGSGVEITVRDEGCGIANGELRRIQEPFVRIREGGSGLGLSISRDIIARLGGVLELSSEVGLGTTVRIRIPYAASALTSEGEACR
ncbi:MAG: hypothetical protein CL910_19140 [Deltaproteobacteria bacterium]|nr:hypothetical protein [Deltaproteobacteria bacterium]